MHSRQDVLFTGEQLGACPIQTALLRAGGWTAGLQARAGAQNRHCVLFTQGATNVIHFGCLSLGAAAHCCCCDPATTYRRLMTLATAMDANTSTSTDA